VEEEASPSPTHKLYNDKKNFPDKIKKLKIPHLGPLPPFFSDFLPQFFDFSQASALPLGQNGRQITFDFNITT